MNMTRTYEAVIQDLLESSPGGWTAQRFLFEAASILADEVAELDPTKMAIPLIDAEAWVACAQTIKARCDAFMEAQYLERLHDQLNEASEGKCDTYYGACPVCHHNDGYLNINRNHFFVCHEHKNAWWVGSNLFSGWREFPEEESERVAEWQRNADLLATYNEVEPWHEPPPAARQDNVVELRRPFPFPDDADLPF